MEMRVNKTIWQMRCTSCAYRRGSVANRCRETKELRRMAEENFICHLAENQGGCAGAVAVFGSARTQAQFLSSPPRVVEAFVSVGETGACRHRHSDVREAWACGWQRSQDWFAVGRLVLPDIPMWGRLTPTDVSQLDAAGLEHREPSYFTAVCRTYGECEHFHQTGWSAYLCALERSYGGISEVRRHDRWPELTGDFGVEATDTEILHNIPSLAGRQ